MPIYKVDGKKDGLQTYKVRVNFVDDFGKPRQLTRIAHGSEQAKALERDLAASVKDKGETPQKRLTLQALFGEFIAAKQSEIRETSAQAYFIRFDEYIAPALGAVPLGRLTVPVLQSWKTSLDARPLSHSTKNDAYVLLGSLFIYAVRMGYIPSNPLSRVGGFKRPLEIAKREEIYTVEDFGRFIAAARQAAVEREQTRNDFSEWDFHTFFTVAFYTGMRKGEIYALKWSDLNGSLLSVSRSFPKGLKALTVRPLRKPAHRFVPCKCRSRLSSR